MTELLSKEPQTQTPSKHEVRNRKKPVRRAVLPGLVWVSFGGTLAASYIPSDLTVLGFRFSGFAWAVSLLVSIVILTQRAPRWRFPLHIWLPWILLLISYLPQSLATPLDPRVSPVQRTCQLLAPIAVGIALSTYRIHLRQLGLFIRRFQSLLIVIWVLGVIMNFREVTSFSNTGLAAQAMTAMLGCVFFICRYFLFHRLGSLGMYAFMATMPVFAITRTVIAVTFTLPTMVLTPMPIIKRAAFIGGSMLAGLLIFSLPQVQRKMFNSGQGELSDISLENGDFATSGRSYVWEKLIAFANQKSWFGHGTGQGETFTYSFTPVGYPHNDWLLSYADYGWFGVGIYLLSNLWMMWDCWRHGHKVKSPTQKLFFYAGASSFIPFMLVMFTDNIMVYASFFGILQYTIIGLAYGTLNTLKKRPKRKRKRVASSRGTPVLTTAKVDLPSTG